MAKYKNEGMSSGIEIIDNSNDLLNVYPNPIGESFSVEFDLIQNSKISIQLVDAAGKWISDLLPAQKVNAGIQKFDFSTPKDMPNGNYFILLNFDNKVIAKKVQLLK